MGCSKLGWGVLKKVLYGKAPPQGPTPFIYKFWQKKYLFCILSFDKWFPFRIYNSTCSSNWLLYEPRFSCDDQALLARCPKHLQSVFLNKKLDSGHPYYGQLTAVKKGYLLTVSHDFITGSSIQLTSWPVIGYCQIFFVKMTLNDLLCADVENYFWCFSLYSF